MFLFKTLLSRSGHLLAKATPPSLQPAAGAAEEQREPMLPWNHPERMLPSNHPESIRVQRMAAGLIAAACDDANYGQRRLSPRIRRPFHGVDWSVSVFDDEYVNGFSTAGGRIWVTTGLLGCKDAAVAAALAHEIGHVIARHTEKKKWNWAMAGFLANFAGELLDAPLSDEKATRKELCTLFMLPCHYSNEYEADRLGLLLLAAAGYDPRTVLPVCRWLWPGEMARYNLSPRHPAPKKRLERLSQAKVMDQALDLYMQQGARSARQGCELR